MGLAFKTILKTRYKTSLIYLGSYKVARLGSGLEKPITDLAKRLNGAEAEAEVEVESPDYCLYYHFGQ